MMKSFNFVEPAGDREANVFSDSCCASKIADANSFEIFFFVFLRCRYGDENMFLIDYHPLNGFN